MSEIGDSDTSHLVEKQASEYQFPEFVAGKKMSKEGKYTVSCINSIVSGITAIEDGVCVEFDLTEKSSDDTFQRFSQHEKNILALYETIRAGISLETAVYTPSELSLKQFEKTAAFLTKSNPDSWQCTQEDDQYKFLFNGELHETQTLDSLREYMRQSIETQTNILNSNIRQIKDIDKFTTKTTQSKKTSVSLAETDIDLLLVKLRISSHELGTAVTPLESYALLEKARQERPEQVERILEFMKGDYEPVRTVLEASKKILTEKHLKHPMTLDIVRSHMNSALSRGLINKVELILDESMYENAARKAVEWDENFIQLFCETIVQNVEKAYLDTEDTSQTTTPKLEVRRFEDDSFVYFGFRDFGNGYSQDLLDQGFVPGLGGWKNKNTRSTRVGLSSHRKVIQDVYKGDIYPTNITDEQGKILGGELVVKLPKLK